jgi:hypothetical protein
VRKLLLLARADAGQLQPHLKPIDISEMISLAVEKLPIKGCADWE